MLVFIFMVFIFALLALILYSPVIIQHFILKNAKNNFTQEFQLLSDFMKIRYLLLQTGWERAQVKIQM